MRTRRFDTIRNGGLTFTELGLGAAPFGNLYKAITEADAGRRAGGGLGERRALHRYGPAIWLRPVRDPG